MKLNDVIQDKFNGSVIETAKAAGVKAQTIRNFKNQDREVLELKNGGYVVVNQHTVVVGEGD